ncbi:MAG: hypothetical protein PsegKO_18760 [Pseudohongiellaceae bacterium]|jgi:hypothetical protein
MTQDEFIQLLEIRGSDLQSWPAAQRVAARALLAADQDASRLLLQQARVDALLGDLPTPTFAGLAARVAQQPLPQPRLSLVDRLLNWIIPDRGIGEFWRPATAACLPLLFGVIVGNYFNFGITTDIQAAENWEDELAMISLTDYTENRVEL